MKHICKSHWPLGITTAITLTGALTWQWQMPASVLAATPPTPTWRSSLPLADPVVRADAQFQARKTHTWMNGDTRFLLLDGDVLVRIGSYGFRAGKAVVQQNDEPSPGGSIRHLAIYFDQVTNLDGSGTIHAQGGRLLVTVSTLGQLILKTDALVNAEPVGDALVQAAQQRMNVYLTSINRPMMDVPTMGPVFPDSAMARRDAVRRELGVELETRLAVRFPELAGNKATQAEASSETGGPVVNVLEAVRIMPDEGTVAYNADKWIPQKTGDDETSVALMGNVRLLYQGNDGRSMSLQAENAVLFLAGTPEDLAERKLGADTVRGIYLEDNVIATDGSYTVRAPRMYYDLQQNKAVLLDAVLYTWDVQKRIPIYLRAEQLRQESRTSFSADRAILTTTEFGQPHFAIGANRVTFAQVQDETGTPNYRFTAEDTTFTFAHLPVFYWPSVSGQLERTSLQRLQVGVSNKTGIKFETKWDLFALTDQTAPQGVKASGRLDFLGEHGPATGLDVKYDRPDMFGDLRGYLLGYDSGDDEIADRNPIERDGEQRGYVHWQHRQYLPENWELSLEFGYASDPLVLETLIRDRAAADKQWETSAYLKKQEEDWAFTILTSYDVNDFTTQLTTLQSPGYVVDKLPELGYYRVGTSLWDDRLTYFSETRLSLMQITPGKDSPSDRGFTNAQSLRRFGIVTATTSFEDFALGNNVPIDWRYRADTRHEIAAPLKVATINVTPYVAGRITAYDNDFAAFAGENDQLRLMGQAGSRFHTQFSQVFDQAESRLLDVHRLRHIVEPRVDVFHTYSSYNPEDVPVYDDDVEGLSEGFGVRAGMRNTLQTQRGGPGRWRDVDWLVLDTDLVHRSDDAPVDAAIARYFGYRPEYSLGGNHFYSNLLWSITDHLASVVELVHNFDSNQMASLRAGLSMHLDPRLTQGISYVDIDPLGERLLDYTLTYQLTTKYAMSVSYIYDVNRNESREVRGALERKVPGWRLIFVGSYDLIDDEQFIGFQLSPEGLSTAGYITPLGLPEE